MARPPRGNHAYCRSPWRDTPLSGGDITVAGPMHDAHRPKARPNSGVPKDAPRQALDLGHKCPGSTLIENSSNPIVCTEHSKSIVNTAASIDGLLYATDEQINVRVRVGRDHPKPALSRYSRYRCSSRR